MDGTLLDNDVADHTQRLVHAAMDRALDLAPNSLDQAHELADRLHDQVPALEKQLTARAKKVERKLEKRAKRLPVDTPFDRRRRHRARRRGSWLALAAIALAGAAAYLIWRRRAAAADLPTGRPDRAEEPETPVRPSNGAGPEDRLTARGPRA